MRPLTATIVCSIAALGCSAPRPPDARVAPPPTDVPIASAPPAPTEPIVPLPAPKNPLDDIKPVCRGAALVFDTEESENECLIPNTGDDDVPPSPGPNDLEITAVVAEKSIAPGGIATVVVTMTNKTKSPMLVYVDLTCDDEHGFPISVFDANKKRVDFVSHKNCDTSTFGCTRRVLRIVLDPGGSMRKKRAFAASVTKVAADCGDVAAGPMRRGSYVLRVVTGFRADAHAMTEYRPRLHAETTLVVK
jgi:hypothetical protein